MPCSEKALEYFARYNCSQAVIAGCRELTKLDETPSLAVAGAFGGGMRRESVCGAVTGGLMALGLIFPFTDNGDIDARDKIGKLSLEFQRRFEAELGCLDCKGLIKGDKAAAKQTVCSKAVATAAQLVEELSR